MNQSLSRNSQIILMLTAPLTAGRGDASTELLSLDEYNGLARLLRDQQRQPSDLIGPASPELIELAAPHFGAERLEALLGRGFLLSQAVEYWGARAIWVMSRADAEYPSRLKSRLKGEAPPVLYGCGERTILETGEGIISVLAGGLESAALARGNRKALMEGELVFISPADPQANPDERSATEREKIIWALADAPEAAEEVSTPIAAPQAPAPASPAASQAPSPAERLLTGVRKILVGELAEPKTEAEIAELLGVTKAQAKAWIRALVESGALEEGAEPGSYQALR